MKNKMLMFLLIGITCVYAQKTKKTITKKAVVTKTSGTSAIAKTVDNPNVGIFANFETSKGNIVLVLEYKKAPITVANFVTLAEGKNTFVTDEKLKNKPFYDGLKFHRVIKDFMIQGGDPAGNGSGGAGYSFKDEFVADLKHDKGGIFSMANSGPATNSSQFFITHKETPWLDGKHTIFGHVISGMDVVNAITQDDIIKKVTITRKGADAMKFDAVKIFSTYFATKGDEDKVAAEARKKQDEAQQEARKKQALLDVEARKVFVEKFGKVMAAKVTYLNEIRATATKTPSGLEYKVIKAGKGVKPADGANVYIHYAGFLEDGTLFDSSYEEVNKLYGKFDENRAKQNGYQPFPFQYGKKDGLIPGFIEGLNNMNLDDKAILFIPSALGYGARGAGNVIPPNSNIIFQVEMLETLPNAAPK
ncbi:MAG: peptidylprolyl isomerase [Flavobacterium sp.]|nr:peptidylprolyl isomerase [Flavobacterium sp.]